MLDTDINSRVLDCFLDVIVSRSPDGIRSIVGQDIDIPADFDEIETLKSAEMKYFKEVLKEKCGVGIGGDRDKLTFELSLHQCKNMVQMAKDRALNEYLIIEFIKAGVSNACLKSLFGLNRHDKKDITDRYGLKPGSAGRPKMIDKQLIIDTFKELNPDTKLPHRIYMVHKTLGTPINSVWFVINDQIDKEGDEELKALMR